MLNDARGAEEAADSGGKAKTKKKKKKKKTLARLSVHICNTMQKSVCCWF